MGTMVQFYLSWMVLLIFLDNPLESLLNRSSSALMWVRIKPPSHHQVFRGLIRIQRYSQMHFSNFPSVISALGN